MIKAAFFDIDGTLVSFATHQVPASTRRALLQLRAQGIKLFISTGRAPQLIPDLDLPFDGYITMNGSYCYVGTQVLLSRPIEQSATRRWLHYAEDHHICTYLFLPHIVYTNMRNPEAYALYRHLLPAEPPVVTPEQMHDTAVHQFIALQPAEADDAVQALLPHCRLPRWNPFFADIVPATISKASGMDALLHHFAIRRDESISFGDGSNDVEMLTHAGIGVAMGNASDDVKAAADYVTTPVDEYGVARALLHYHLIPDDAITLPD